MMERLHHVTMQQPQHAASPALVILVLGLLYNSAQVGAATATAALLLSPSCDPAGTWFSTHDHGRHQPLMVQQSAAALPGCPDTQLVRKSYLASASHAWQNDSLCLYRNGRCGAH
jgi:hypothetical protein